MDNLKQGYVKQPYPFPTKRYCQMLFLNVDEKGIEEYKYWHKKENIWKEIPDGIRRAGILNMEIYLHGNIEFMIVETPLDFDWDEAFGRLATYERQAEWEEFMSQFQKTEGTSRSNEKLQLMERILTLDE